VRSSPQKVLMMAGISCANLFIFQEKVAESMLCESLLRAPPAKVRDTVSLLVDKVDGGPTHPPSLVRVVLQQHDDGSVTLGCRVGRLPGKFPRSCYKVCPEPILSAE
jgi:hypothetical protein